MAVFQDFNGMIEIFFAVCSIQIISVVKFQIIYSKFLNTSMNNMELVLFQLQIFSFKFLICFFCGCVRACVVCLATVNIWLNLNCIHLFQFHRKPLKL
jgi:hypothetical protein